VWEWIRTLENPRLAGKSVFYSVPRCGGGIVILISKSMDTGFAPGTVLTGNHLGRLLVKIFLPQRMDKPPL
jgi:hypothetical protein